MKSRPIEDTRLAGVIAAAVTPRRAGERQIDLGATLELIDFLRAGGVQAIALLGPIGEFVHFSLEDRRHMVHLAAKRSQLPLLVNCSHSTLDGSIELAREAAQSGVAGVMLMPPIGFQYGREAIHGFYLAFAEAVGNSSPIYLSDAPGFGTRLEPSLAAELLATERFAGIEDSSGDPETLRLLAEATEGTKSTLLAGQERGYAQMKRLGANGLVSGVACAVPELMVALDQALGGGNQERIAGLEARLTELLKWMDQFPLPAAAKEAVRQRGLHPGAFAAPLGQPEEQKLARFGEWFRSWLPDVLRDCGA